MSNQSYKTISFAINNSNFEYYDSNLIEINKYIKLKKKIPYSLVENHFLIQLPLDYAKIDETSAKIRIAANKAREYFKPSLNPGYNFDGTTPIKDGDNDALIAYSMDNLFLLCTSNFYNSLSSGKLKEEKDDVIRFFYSEIRKYRNDMFSAEHKPKLKHYKIAVIAAYLTNAVGFKVCNKKDFTNRELFQSSRNALATSKV